MALLRSLFGTKNELYGKRTLLDKNTYAAALAKNNARPIDIRTASEFNNGHLKNALNIDFFNASSFKEYFEKLDREKAIYVYCRSGARSQKAARNLLKMGFSKIYDLKGGYLAWN